VACPTVGFVPYDGCRLIVRDRHGCMTSRVTGGASGAPMRHICSRLPRQVPPKYVMKAFAVLTRLCADAPPKVMNDARHAGGCNKGEPASLDLARRALGVALDGLRLLQRAAGNVREALAWKMAHPCSIAQVQVRCRSRAQPLLLADLMPWSGGLDRRQVGRRTAPPLNTSGRSPTTCPRPSCPSWWTCCR
jgi:hypothetical protein